MLRKCVQFFNSIIINNIKFMLIKICNPTRFKFCFYNLISPFATIDIQGNGSITFKRKCQILSGTTIGVRKSGKILIGNNTFINKNCQIICHQKIVLGNDVEIGPNVVIMDHDHIFSKNGIEKKKFKCSDIEIGNNVWIGAGVIILRGTKIGDNTIIGAGSILKGEFPSNSVIVQKRISTITENKGND